MIFCVTDKEGRTTYLPFDLFINYHTLKRHSKYIEVNNYGFHSLYHTLDNPETMPL